MMTYINSVELTKERARDAFARGVKRADHGMNWNAVCLPDWLAEWDRCADLVESVGQCSACPSCGKEH